MVVAFKKGRGNSWVGLIYPLVELIYIDVPPGWKDGGGEEGNNQRAWACQQEQTWY